MFLLLQQAAACRLALAVNAKLNLSTICCNKQNPWNISNTSLSKFVELY